MYRAKGLPIGLAGVRAICMGLSTSRSDTEYRKHDSLPGWALAYNAVKVHHVLTALFGSACMEYTAMGGDFQDLIMWDQLPDAARAALNDSSNWGRAEVPFSDENIEDRLESGYPF
ncbi:unnamed protein product [Phytophthora lilii]|uniref:Unnamed protein product n=1 Tax=Phytophthora lilii TaxID=2077276 RepID=A0A9W6U6B7_9STRA|nr:unnamed protein product [Phytophthora lilii]